MAKPVRPRRYRLMRLARRAALALIATGIAVYLPPHILSINPFVNLWLTGIVVVLLVCYLGKLLYDTLFYDHRIP